MYDGGTLRVTQPITLNHGSLEVREGTSLVFDGAFTSSVSTRYSGATSTSLVLTNGATLLVGSAANSSVLTGTQANPARMFVESGSTFATSPECATNVATKALTIGHSDGGFGILTVNGGTVRHKVMLGEGVQNGGGAIIQNGGVVENQGGAANDIRLDLHHVKPRIRGGDTRLERLKIRRGLRVERLRLRHGLERSRLPEHRNARQRGGEQQHFLESHRLSPLFE